MKIKIGKKFLANAVNTVIKAVPAKSSLAILESIRISAVGNSIDFTGNDLELGITCRTEGTIIEQGTVCVDAKLFSDMVRKLPDGDVTLQTDDKFMTVLKCGRSKFQIAGKDAELYPIPKFVEADASFELSELTLRDSINQTIFCADITNTQNKMLSGLLLEVKGYNLRFVALDGHRIAIRNIALPEENSNISVVLPGKNAIELAKILTGGIDDKVKIGVSDSNVSFQFADTFVVSNLLAGSYFKVDNMLSSAFDTSMKVNRKEFMETLDRATTLTSEGDKRPVILDIKETSMDVSISSVKGNLSEEIEVEALGKPINIGFNPKFLLDTFKSIEDESLDIYMSNPKAPAFIKNKEESYIYVVLPVNVR